MNSTVQPKPRRCPICSDQAADDTYRPFCSRRCADVDLGRWLNGSYTIPGTADDDGADRPVKAVGVDGDV